MKTAESGESLPTETGCAEACPLHLPDFHMQIMWFSVDGQCVSEFGGKSLMSVGVAVARMAAAIPGQAPGSAGASLDEEIAPGSSAGLLLPPLSGSTSAFAFRILLLKTNTEVPTGTTDQHLRQPKRKAGATR